jgi:phenylalanyl-tRNA synthetase beta chain
VKSPLSLTSRSKYLNQRNPRPLKKRCDVSVEDSKACPRYIGTLIEGVQVKGSSEDVLKKLNSLGSRAINNAVDITNVCLMDMGQPLHVFDYDKLEGKKIIVRFAKQGEKIVTLDGVERTLDSTMLVIADAKKPVAIAGVMGGLSP